MVQIELGTGDSVRVVFAESDGGIVVEFSEDAIRVTADGYTYTRSARVQGSETGKSAE